MATIYKMAPIYDYEPRFDSRKSFYGKAQEMERENGDKILFSYWTPILKITADDKLYLTSYYNYSDTTLRHAVDFVKNYKKDYHNLGHNRADFLRLNAEAVITNWDRLNNGDLINF